MFKKIWDKVVACALTEHGVVIDFGITRLFIGMLLGLVLTTAIILTYM